MTKVVERVYRTRDIVRNWSKGLPEGSFCQEIHFLAKIVWEFGPVTFPIIMLNIKNAEKSRILLSTQKQSLVIRHWYRPSNLTNSTKLPYFSILLLFSILKQSRNQRSIHIFETKLWQFVQFTVTRCNWQSVIENTHVAFKFVF